MEQLQSGLVVVKDSDLGHVGGDLGKEIGRTHKIKKVEMGDSGDREMVGGDGRINPIGEEEGRSGGGSQVKVGGQGGECAVWARVVVKHRRCVWEEGHRRNPTSTNYDLQLQEDTELET